jgi:uncharacterized protein (DUF305 family)
MRSGAARIAAAFAVLLAVGMLTGCGGSPDRHGAPSGTATSSGPADHNADDIAFARNMIPLHEQAVQMSQLVPTNTTNAQVIALAGEITSTEVPWTDAFRSFLMQWQDTGNGSSGQQGTATRGMLDPRTMDRLQTLRGPDFDRLWLTSMIANHRGAMAMAGDEVAHGHNPDVIYLARSVITTQQPEIDLMNHMLGG